MLVLETFAPFIEIKKYLHLFYLVERIVFVPFGIEINVVYLLLLPVIKIFGLGRS